MVGDGGPKHNFRHPPCSQRVGGPLKPCSVSTMPVTGYTHDGTCSLHSDWCDTKQNWCVCEWAFETAVRKLGCDAFDLKCDATNRLAHEHYERTGTTHAASCIRSRCENFRVSSTLNLQRAMTHLRALSRRRDCTIVCDVGDDTASHECKRTMRRPYCH